MVPSKCRPAAGNRPGPGVSLEYRIQKEQPYLHNRLLQHDLEKNYSGKLADGRLSPLARSKKAYVPASSQFTDIPGLDMKHGSGTLSAFGDCSFPNPSKYRTQPGSHHAAPNISEVSYGNASFPMVHRSTEEKVLHSDRVTLER
ncbi:hypothetical protein lerEdw1_008587 [Lerista edwardsae]|nr:hypothetical protein lerEdw1_008587 [Lerista edwardsae]